MKKKLLKGVVLAGLIGGFTFSAFAQSQQGQTSGSAPYYWGPGLGPGPYCLVVPANIPDEKVQKFYQDNAELFQKVWSLRDELRRLHFAPNPDWKAIAEKRAEMAKLISELHNRAAQEGIPLSFGRGFKGKGFRRGYGAFKTYCP